MVHRIHTKFILLFFVLFFIPFGVLTLISVSMSKGMMKQGTISHLQNLVDVKGVAIEHWLRERIGDGKTIAESREIKSLNPRKIEPYVRLVQNFYPAYREISVFDRNGKRIPEQGETSFDKED